MEITGSRGMKLNTNNNIFKQLKSFKMLNKIKKNILIIICFSALLFSSCALAGTDPVDKQLNNLEKVISKYEKKAGKSGLTQMDLQTMNTELEAIGTEAPVHITSAQEQRFLALGKREEKLEDDAGALGQQIK